MAIFAAAGFGLGATGLNNTLLAQARANNNGPRLLTPGVGQLTPTPSPLSQAKAVDPKRRRKKEKPGSIATLSLSNADGLGEARGLRTSYAVAAEIGKARKGIGAFVAGMDGNGHEDKDSAETSENEQLITAIYSLCNNETLSFKEVEHLARLTARLMENSVDEADMKAVDQGLLKIGTYLLGQNTNISAEFEERDPYRDYETQSAEAMGAAFDSAAEYFDLFSAKVGEIRPTTLENLNAPQAELEGYLRSLKVLDFGKLHKRPRSAKPTQGKGVKPLGTGMSLGELEKLYGDMIEEGNERTGDIDLDRDLKWQKEADKAVEYRTGNMEPDDVRTRARELIRFVAKPADPVAEEIGEHELAYLEEQYAGMIQEKGRAS